MCVRIIRECRGGDNMSLLDRYKTDCTIVIPVEESDGEGGFTITWVDGAVFQAHIGYNSNAESRRAEQQGLARIYSVLVQSNVDIKYNDYFRADGATYRVTSAPEDNHSPDSASMRLKHFTAEKRDLQT